MVTEKDFAAWNEAMIQRYDPEAYHRHSNPIFRWMEAQRVRKVIQVLDPQSDQRILEVGCGPGAILERIGRGKLFGMDISASAITRAKVKLGSRAELACSNAESLPFAGTSFDKIYCSEVLEHVLHPGKVLEEMRRVVRPGGVLVVTVPNERLINVIKSFLLKINLFDFFFKSKDYRSPERMDNEWHLHEFDLSYLKKCLPAGMKISKAWGIPFGFLPLRYVVRLESDR